LLVFLVHYTTLIQPWLGAETTRVAEAISSVGLLGVDLFFVLSGFLIYGSIIQSAKFSFVRYALRRIQRIYPTFLAVLAIYVVLSLLAPDQSKLPQGFAHASFYILQNILLLPGMFSIQPIITVAWSLSFEIFFYLLIPLAIIGLRLKSWSSNQRILFWSVAAFAYITFCHLPEFRYSLDHKVHLIMFVSGILLFEFHSVNKRYFVRGGTTALLLAFTVYALKPAYAYKIYGFDNTFCVSAIFILFILTALSAFNSQSRSYKWLSFTPIRWLGNMSYSYYLTHSLALKLCFIVYGSLISRSIGSEIFYILLIPSFVATLIASYLVYYAIERRFSL